MTKRRLLQRLALLPLAALLCALLVACGGGGDSSTGACPGWLRDEGNAPTPEATAEASVGLERAVMRAYSIARGYYITPYDWRRGLNEAWSAAEQAMHKANMNGPDTAPRGSTDQELFNSYRAALAELDKAIRGRPEEQAIIEAALVAFARSFKDGHTHFLSKSRWEAHQNGSVYSYGLLTAKDRDDFVITEVLPGSIAMAAGVMPGDVIVGSQLIEDEARTSGGRTFTLSIQKRTGGEHVLDVKVAAEPFPWLRYELLPGEIGYIRLFLYPSFRTCTSLVKIRAALDDALADLSRRGTKAWIVDMRDNGGGSAESAAFVATRLGFDGLLARSRDKEGRRNDIEVLEDNAIGNAPLVIMINENSASSSEVVAYTLQASRRAYVIGTQSAGAVVASYAFPLAGGAFFVTGAFIDVGPGNKVLDKIGVTPDQKVALDLELLRREGRDSQLEAATTYLKQKLGR
jgi:carboxyl-terminal processing protease